MTEQELRQRIFAMNEPAWKELRADIGGEGDRERLVREFRENPRMEKKLAALLFLPTEEERLHHATLASSRATVEAAEHSKDANEIAQRALSASKWSTVWAFAAFAVALASLIVSVLKD